jgi:hypothetical protein
VRYITYIGYFGPPQNVRTVAADAPSLGSMIAAIDRLPSRAERDRRDALAREVR